MFLIFKNCFNNTKKVWVQFLCIIFLLISGMGIFYANTSFAKNLQSLFNTRYNNGLHQFSTSSFDYTKYELNGVKVEDPEQLQNYFNTYKDKFNYDVAQINYFSTTTKIKSLNLTIEITQLSHNLNNNSYIDSTYPTRWSDPSFPLLDNSQVLLKNHILINELWAKNHGYEVGSKIEIYGRQFTISGYDIPTQYFMNVLGNSFLPDKENQCLFVVNQDDYKDLKLNLPQSKEAIYWAFRFNDLTKKNQVLSKYANFENFIHQNLTLPDKKSAILDDIWTPSTPWNAKINFILSAISNNQFISNIFLSIILGISFIILFIVIKKMIEDSQLQIGCLKALGYPNFKVAFGFTSFIFQALFIASILSFLIGQFLIPRFYASSGQINYIFLIPSFYFSATSLLLSILVPLFALFTFGICVSYFYVRKSSLGLMTGANLYKNGILTKYFAPKISGFPFALRFPLFFTFKSFGKISIISLTTLFSTFFIFFVFAAAGIANFVVSQTKQALNFNYIYSFNSSVKNNPTFTLVGDENFDHNFPAVNDTLSYEPSQNMFQKSIHPWDYTSPSTPTPNYQYLSYWQTIDAKYVKNNFYITELNQETIYTNGETWLKKYWLYEMSQNINPQFLLNGFFIDHNTISYYVQNKEQFLNSFPIDRSIIEPIMDNLTLYFPKDSHQLESFPLILPIGFSCYSLGYYNEEPEMPFFSTKSNALLYDKDEGKNANINVEFGGYNFSDQKDQTDRSGERKIDYTNFFSKEEINLFANWNPQEHPHILPVEATDLFLKTHRLSVGDEFALMDGSKPTQWKAKIIYKSTDLFRKTMATNNKILSEYLNEINSIPNIDNDYIYQPNTLLSYQKYQYVINDVLPFLVNLDPSIESPLIPAISNLPINVQMILKNLEATLSLFNAFINIFVSIAGFIALIIMILIVNVLIQENRYFIGTMKVLGYRNKEINWLFVLTYMPFVILSIIVGMIIAYFILTYLSNVLADKTSAPLYFNISFETFLLTPLILLIIMMIAISSSYLSILKARLLDLTSNK